MDYCSDHLVDLFESGEYAKALDTTFITAEDSYSVQVILIFCGVFLLLAISVTLMCTFMRNKGNRSHLIPVEELDTSYNAEHQRRNRYESDDESSDYAKRYRRPNARASSALRESQTSSDNRHFGGESDC